jgi:cyclase
MKPRVIPVITISEGRVVKTVNFHNPKYVGDVINTVKIFSDLGADEIIILDITATLEKKVFDLRLLEKLVRFCSVPLGVGGGIRQSSYAQKIVSTGCEKIVINSHAFSNPEMLTELSSVLGTQAIVGGIDYIKSINRVTSHSGTIIRDETPVNHGRFLEKIGVGEIFLNNIEADGTRKGIDFETPRLLSNTLEVPIIACGGIGSQKDIMELYKLKSLSAIGVGSFFMFHEDNSNVAIHYENNLE